MPTYFLTAFEYCVIAVAPTFLIWEWVRRAGSKQYPATLIYSTISCLWLFTGLIWRNALGPDYSNLHAYIAIANVVVNLLCGLVAVAIRTQRSFRIMFASLFLSIVWFFTLAIMYAV